MKVFVLLLFFTVTTLSSESNAAIRPIKNPRSSNQRIVGGEDAVQNEYPWVAAIFRGANFYCGGSYIRNARSSAYHAYVLTAAHCVKDVNVNSYTIHLGSYNLSLPVQSYEQQFNVIESFIHPEYNENSLENDIALLRLDRVPETTKSVKRGLLTRFEVDFNANGTVIGWGDLAEGGDLSPVLQQVELQIQTDSVCSSSMGPSYDKNSMFCSGPPEGGLDACMGDSGSPFMVRDGNKMRISGVVSWGVGCAQPDKYGVYSDVKAAKPYIRSILKST